MTDNTSQKRLRGEIGSLLQRKTQHGPCGCAENGGHSLPWSSRTNRHDERTTGKPMRGELVTAGETVDEQIGLTATGHLRAATTDRTQRGPFPVVEFDGLLCHDALAVSDF